MSKHVADSSSALGIRLEGNKTRYSPGDVVVGSVYRTAPGVCANVRVAISLHGRSESKVTVVTGYTVTTYLGRFIFFNSHNTGQVLQHNGPLDIPAGSSGASWPFAITIPSFVNRETLVAPGISQEFSYLPLAPDSVSSQPAPSIFEFKGHKPSFGLSGFVEYYLQAELRLSDQVKGTSSRREKAKVHEAIRPLDVERIVPGPPITDFKLVRKAITQYVSSQRLVPGMQDAGLSLFQKTQKLLGSSKVPKLGFRVHVDAPTVLQLESEISVPFRVRVEPVWDRTSATIRGVPQSMKLESLVVCIQATTEIKVIWKGLISQRPFTAGCSSKEVNIFNVNETTKFGKEIDIPCVGTDTTAGSCQNQPQDTPVDIGKLVNFNLSRQALRSIEKQADATKLYPTFKTYNIKHSHQLTWRLVGVIAAEKIELAGNLGLTLLPPPCWDPIELEAPPDHPPLELEAPQGLTELEAEHLPLELEAPQGLSELEATQEPAEVDAPLP